MKISKNICIGLFISGTMAYFEEDRGKEPILSIERALEKKLFVFRNGTTSFREKAKKAMLKKKKSKKDVEILQKVQFYNERFLLHSKVSDRAWIKLQNVVSGNTFTANALIGAILYKVPEAKKYYSFSPMMINNFLGIDNNKPVYEQFHNYSFRSLKVANLLLKFLDEEINRELSIL